MILCALCQQKIEEDKMVAHHKDGDRTNNHPNNIAIFCRKCHSLIHRMRQTTFKKSNVINIYIPSHLHPMLTECKKIVAREGRSLSKLFLEFMSQYVAKHIDGNPQLKLDFINEPGLLPKYRQCKHSNQALYKAEFFCRQDGLWCLPKKCDTCIHYHKVKE